MKKNLFFTLIELITVIVVISILAAIVIPNISGFKEEATMASVVSNVKNLQTASDIYTLDNNGQLPVMEGVKPLSYLNPLPVDLATLKPDYIRKSPKESGYRYWIDFKGTVWASKVDAPTGVAFQAALTSGSLTWNTVEEAEYYRVYRIEGISTVSSAVVNTKAKISFQKEVPATNESPILTDLPNGEYVVSSVDNQGFESPPAGGDYLGYEIIVKEYEEITGSNSGTPVEEDSNGSGNSNPKPSGPQPIQRDLPSGWIGIYTIEDLELVRAKSGSNTAKFMLMENLDFGIEPYNDGNWEPIRGIRGDFDGNGLTISNLKLTSKETQHYVGLFGDAGLGSSIKNLTLENVHIESVATTGTGGIAGHLAGSITNSRVTGKISGISSVGGIAGRTTRATLKENSTDIVLSGIDKNIGGIVGYSTESSYYNNYTDGSISGVTGVGGILGRSYTDKIYYNYSVALNNGGGIVGKQDRAIFSYESHNFWDKEKTGTTSSAIHSSTKFPSLGKTTAEMKMKTTYTDFDFETIWKIEEGVDYPKLRNTPE